MLNLKKITRKSKRFGISGKGGCGKTTAYTRIYNNPIIFDLEKKFPFPDIPVVDLPVDCDLSGFKQALNSLVKEDLSEYDAVVIDTISELENMCEKYAINQDYKGSKAKYSAYYSGDNNELPQYFSEVLAILERIQQAHDIDIVFVIHTTQGNEPNPMGVDYSKIKLDLKKRIYAKVQKWLDYLGCVFDDAVIEEDGLKHKATGSVRRISFDSTSPFFDAKCLRDGEVTFEFDIMGEWCDRLFGSGEQAPEKMDVQENPEEVPQTAPPKHPSKLKKKKFGGK